MRKHIAAIFVALAVCIGLVGCAQTAHAGSLSISPLRTEITLNPGETTSGILDVKNGGDEPGEVALSSEAFQVTDGSYDYSFSADAEATSWVQFELVNFTLQPGELKRVQYSLAIPQKAQPGGKYLALIASLTPASSKSVEGITPLQRAASLLYITLPGDITRTGKLKGISAPAVSFTSPVNWSYNVANTGSVHFRSRSNIRVRTLWGSVISQEETDPLILPGTVRTVNGKSPLNQMPGVYQIEFTVGLGDTPAATTKKWLLYLPPVGTTLLVVSIVAIGYIAARSLRKKR